MTGFWDDGQAECGCVWGNLAGLIRNGMVRSSRRRELQGENRRSVRGNKTRRGVSWLIMRVQGTASTAGGRTREPSLERELGTTFDSSAEALSEEDDAISIRSPGLAQANPAKTVLLGVSHRHGDPTKQTIE